jgi:uncharacterized RDD family membrane protein YckC
VASYRKIVRASPAYEQPDIISPIVFNLEPGQIVEVASEDHPTYVEATHLRQRVYIAREDTVQATPEEIALTQPEPASAVGNATVPVSNASEFCPRCGVATEPGARFCRQCGGSLAATGAGTGEPASFWRRLGAYLIDYVLVTVVFAIPPSLVTGGPPGLIFLVALFMPVAYYIVGYGIGQTLGCVALGVRIQTEDGGEPGFGRGFIRWFISIFSALAIGLGYFWMIWDPKKQTWHDKAAGTLVVKR